MLKNGLNSALSCVWKWFVAAGVISMIMQLFTAVTMLIIYGNRAIPRWAEMWIGITLMVLLIGALAALITYWEDVKDMILY